MTATLYLRNKKHNSRILGRACTARSQGYNGSHPEEAQRSVTDTSCVSTDLKLAQTVIMKTNSLNGNKEIFLGKKIDKKFLCYDKVVYWPY